MDRIIYFKINGFNLWNGGLNYIKQLKKNLLTKSIELVILVNDFDKIGISKLNSYLIEYSLIYSNKYLRVLNYFFLRIGLSFTILKKHKHCNNKANIIYHGLIPVRYFTHKHQTTYWLPDILHKIYPQNFSTLHYYKRLIFTNINLKLTDRILLSSHSIKKQLKSIYNIDKNIIVYQFSSKIDIPKDFDRTFTKPVVLFPHEFWSHKRQEKIVDLANNNKDFIFLLTGNNRINQKNSSYEKFNCALKYLKHNNLINFGEIDWNLLTQLYSQSTYIGNLSDYEGWNTSVEIAKYLGKNLILSKIDVHIEQTLNYKNIIWHKNNVKLPQNLNQKVKYSYNKELSNRLEKFCADFFQ